VLRNTKCEETGFWWPIGRHASPLAHEHRKATVAQIVNKTTLSMFVASGHQTAAEWIPGSYEHGRSCAKPRQELVDGTTALPDPNGYVSTMVEDHVIRGAIGLNQRSIHSELPA
jgi:hypothetical protein